MKPSIVDTVKQGFQLAKKSWKAIGLFAGCWIITGLLSILAIAMTGVPQEILQPAGQEEIVAAGDEAAVGAFGGVGEEQVRVAGEWVQRSWPVLLLVVLLVIAANLWLTGGQIGYVAHLANTQQPELGTFVSSGTNRFMPLLGAWGLMLGAFTVLSIVGGLVGWIFSLLSALPGWLLGTLGVILGVAMIAAMVWLSVKLVFWFVAIVVDGVGPVAGLKASFNATKGQWLSVFGLVLLLMVIFYVVGAVFGLIEWVSGFLGGFGTVLVFLSNLANLVVNLYLAFAMIGAYVWYYRTSKGNATPGTEVPAPVTT